MEELNTSDEEDEGVKQIEPTEPKTEQNSSPSIGIVDILRFLFLVFIISSGLSYYITSDSIIWGYQRPWFTRPQVLLRYFVSIAYPGKCFEKNTDVLA